MPSMRSKCESYMTGNDWGPCNIMSHQNQIDKHLPWLSGNWEKHKHKERNAVILEGV